MPNQDASARNLPSWMSSGATTTARPNDPQFTKLLDGVVFALSGFVNPERGTLRSQALEMGAEYRADWTHDCTLLVCAFRNTPKFRQVAADNGTIVSKEWISECYSQKKLVDIDSFLMHAGKPWRKNNIQPENNKGQKDTKQEEPRKRPGRISQEKQCMPAKSKGGLYSTAKDQFSPSKIKEWAINDLNKTVSWLENQDEKPEASEIKAIAAQGIITCLQDAIESLKENKDIHHMMDQWMFIPHVVKQLGEFEAGEGKKRPLPKDELCELALTCKEVYQTEYDRIDSSSRKKGKRKAAGSDKEDNRNVQASSEDDDGSDSDRTIEMTEEEIEVACKQLSAGA